MKDPNLSLPLFFGTSCITRITIVRDDTKVHRFLDPPHKAYIHHEQNRLEHVEEYFLPGRVSFTREVHLPLINLPARLSQKKKKREERKKRRRSLENVRWDETHATGMDFGGLAERP